MMADVVDLREFKRKKKQEDELTRGGRTPLYVSHSTGKVTGAPPSTTPKAESPVQSDFGDRLVRIRASLEKINRLMADLKRMGDENKYD